MRGKRSWSEARKDRLDQLRPLPVIERRSTRGITHLIGVKLRRLTAPQVLDAARLQPTTWAPLSIQQSDGPSTRFVDPNRRTSVAGRDPDADIPSPVNALMAMLLPIRGRFIIRQPHESRVFADH